jgi:hypothetical protein
LVLSHFALVLKDFSQSIKDIRNTEVKYCVYLPVMGCEWAQDSLLEKDIDCSCTEEGLYTME